MHLGVHEYDRAGRLVVRLRRRPRQRDQRGGSCREELPVAIVAVDAVGAKELALFGGEYLPEDSLVLVPIALYADGCRVEAEQVVSHGVGQLGELLLAEHDGDERLVVVRVLGERVAFVEAAGGFAGHRRSVRDHGGARLLLLLTVEHAESGLSYEEQ